MGLWERPVVPAMGRGRQILVLMGQAVPEAGCSRGRQQASHRACTLDPTAAESPLPGDRPGLGPLATLLVVTMDLHVSTGAQEALLTLGSEPVLTALTFLLTHVPK